MTDTELLVFGAMVKKLAEKNFEPIIQKYNLRSVELDLLVFMDHGDFGNTARDFMYARHLSKAHISKSVENLKKRDLIRLNEDPEDRRVLHISLTGEAKEIVQAVEAKKEEYRKLIYQGITIEEQQVLEQTFQKMLQNIKHELG